MININYEKAKAYDAGYKQRDAAIVRCGSCKFWNAMWKGCKRNPSVEQWNPEDFCSYGCRKGETDDEAD